MNGIEFIVQQPEKITDLQMKCVELGVCPNCHNKALKEVGSFQEFKGYQCKHCFHIWIV